MEKEMRNMKCPDCDEEMTQTQNIPDELLSFTIPFFRHIEIKVWRWIDDPFCLECAMAKQRRPEEAAYWAGREDGGRKAMEEMGRYT